MNLDVTEVVKTFHEVFMFQIFPVRILIYYGNLHCFLKDSEHEYFFLFMHKEVFLHEVPLF